jgi:hypothetical protein
MARRNLFGETPREVRERDLEVLSDIDELERRMRDRGELKPGDPSPFDELRRVHRKELEELDKPKGPFPTAQLKYGGLVPEEPEFDSARRKF